jgi:hypothetical protein
MIKTNLSSLLPRRQTYAKAWKLISGGYVNRAAFPNGMITIYPWDTEIDDYLVNATTTGEQNVLYGVLERVCNLNGCKVGDFVFSEVITVLLIARSAGSGGVLRYMSDCPACRTKEEEQIRVPEELEPQAQKPPDYSGFDVITLPACADKVAIRPLQVDDEKGVGERPAEERKRVEDGLLRKLLPVVTINDSRPDSLEELLSWYLALPPEDSRFLTEQEEALSPQLNRRIPHKCRACGTEFFHVLNFNERFFRGRGEGKSRPSLAQTIRDGVGREGVHNRPAQSA